MESLCGICGAKGLKKQLVLFQLNLEEAILMCESKECIYPLGVADNSKLIVRRQASEISANRRKRKKKHKTKELVVPEIKNDVKELQSLESYLHWQNVDALCWLHSLLSLIVHNVTLVTTALSLAQNGVSLLKTVVTLFNNAQDVSSADREQAMGSLKEARDNVWRYLQPSLKCQHGVQDSPVTALPLLLRENGALAEKALQIYRWEFNCNACGYHQIDKRSKHLVTFPNVGRNFGLHNPVFERQCFKCGASKQRSKLVYERMPECVLFHFEQGLQSFEDLNFKGHNEHYILTQIIQYKRSPDHFICWTREPKGNRWMEIDDLNFQHCSWVSLLPNIPPSEVHIAVWEKVSSNLISQLTTLKEVVRRGTEQNLTIIKESCSDTKCSSRPLSDIDCNVTIASTVINGKKTLNSPTSCGPDSSLPIIATGSRVSRRSQAKLKAGKFEPYIPRKKRLLSPSSTNSSVCSRQDFDISISSPLSPSPSQPFLTWQDIKEQTNKLNVDDLQSDSGYSSPLSVSSCSSLPLGQSIGSGNSLSDCLEDVHTSNDAEKQELDKVTDDAVRDNFAGSVKVALSVSLSGKTKSSMLQGENQQKMSSHSTSWNDYSIELASELDELLPDCLMENSKEFSLSDSISANLKLADIEKLSDEQDQFIRDLLVG